MTVLKNWFRNIFYQMLLLKKMHQLSRTIFTSLVLFTVCIAMGQQKKDTISLPELLLKGQPIQQVLQKTAASVGVITSKDIDKTDGVIVTPILNQIPGVTMQQGALNTNRITIRGIGARAQFGTTKIKAYYGGIPLTTAEGETTIDDIDLSFIEKIEIIKGPNSTSFGSGFGGVIQLFPKELNANSSIVKSAVTVGSFGLMQQQYTAGFSTSKASIATSFTDVESEGYRDNSSYKRTSFNIHSQYKITTRSNLTLLGMYTKLKAYIPSSINEFDLNNNPRKAAPTWLASRGYESYNKFLLGVGYDHKFSSKWTVNATIFSNFKKSYEPRPFDILEDQAVTFGFRSNINYQDFLFSLPIAISLGTELLTEKYENSLYQNLYQTQSGNGSIQGNSFSSFQQNRNYSNFFLQMNLELTKKVSLETGLAYNTTHYTLEDIFLANDTNSKTDYTFGTIWTPRIGISYAICTGKNIFAAISKGFSVPTVAETLTPEGQINLDLKPEIGWNYEVGFKGRWLKNLIYSEIVVYSTQIENLLVARRTSNDQFVGINAGSSSHSGIEFLVNVNILNRDSVQLSSFASGAVNNFRFKDFTDGNNTYSGNELTGVPEKQFNFGIDVNTKKGFGFNTAFRTVSQIPLNDANTKYSARYSLLDLKVAYSFTILKNLSMKANAGINNILNKQYAANILPNAVGFGTAAPRYFYPGNPVNYYGGFSVVYDL
jgi:iron complex outermembrane receptor protein